MSVVDPSAISFLLSSLGLWTLTYWTTSIHLLDMYVTSAKYPHFLEITPETISDQNVSYFLLFCHGKPRLGRVVELCGSCGFGFTSMGGRLPKVSVNFFIISEIYANEINGWYTGALFALYPTTIIKNESTNSPIISMCIT